VTGTTALHAELESQLAEFTGASAALVFSSGYLANLTVITALAAGLGAACGVLIVSDARNHASLIDACRLARTQGGAKIRVAVTPHRDAAAVRRALAARDEPAAIVVSDAVFSVDGALAAAAELHAAAREHGALLVLDEAHAFGVIGPRGRGVAAAAGIAAEPDLIRTVTLSKTAAGQGGAALAALQVIVAEPGLGVRALANTARLAALANGLGLRTRPTGAAVLAIILGEAGQAARAQQTCAGHGVRAGCFRPPSVPAGEACLRLTGRADMTMRDFTIAARALAAVSEHSVS
jgi:8-amino-7-oxononanoate synthase